MTGLVRSHRDKIPFLGDMLFSLLAFPAAFSFMERWVKSPKAADTALWLGALYATLGMVHLFRAFRLRGRFRFAFVAHLVYCIAFMAVGALSAVAGLTETTLCLAVLTFMGYLLSERVLDIVRNRRLGRIILDGIAIALILVIMFSLTNMSMLMIIAVGFAASFSSLATIMALLFSQIQIETLKEIVRKTYAVEIIGGLLVMMVAFSNVLVFTDDAFSSFWDALWYCFAIVTTIGFGDLTPTTATGRALSVILGIYGIVVVALITSIIVNFYGEMKKKNLD